MDKSFKHIWVGAMVFVAVLLSGCANQASTVSNGPLETKPVEQEPAANEQVQPAFYYLDSAEKRLLSLEEHLKSDFIQSGTTGYYYYNYVDLNGDQNNEVLVWIRTELPKGKDKSSFIVYSADFKIIFQHENGVPPVIVLKDASNGWSDLAMFIGKGQYKRLVFDKTTYGVDDNSKENVIEFSELLGRGYLADVNSQKGFQIK